jgi:hypothetical protein
MNMRLTLDRLNPLSRSTVAKVTLPLPAIERRSKWILAFIASTLAAVAPAQSLVKNVGFYHWAGQYSDSVSQGVEQTTQLGSRAVRITLSPKYYTDYNIGGTCYPNFSLSTIAQETNVKRALDNPNIEVFMLTAYDGTSFGDCVNHRYLNPGFYTPSNVSAMVAEYSDFTLYLYETYRSTHKRFIISNWESDNDIYCGVAYAYATDKSTRKACDAAYPTLYGNETPNDSLEGLQLWLQVRREGIEDGKRRARNAGIGGNRVYLAPEFCVVHALHDAGFKSVLYNVLPFVSFDYVSYSSYESINQPVPDKALAADLDIIQSVVGSNAIIIGEFGFSRSFWGSETAVARTDRVLNAALAWGVAYIFQWNLYDQSVQQDLGLYDVAGMPTALADYYRQRLAAANQVPGRGRCF